MPEIYADWKSLKPLTNPVPVWTKCVVIGNTNNHRFECGQIVYRTDDEPFKKAYAYSDGDDYWWLLLVDVALLPADYHAAPTAEQKPERKAERKEKRHIVAIQVDGHHVIHAVCNDGSMWTKYPGFSTWERSNIPPIPQD